MVADNYKVNITDIFEGPMDLLLHLIKKNEVNIYDIPIAIVTDQYLEYIEMMKALNVDLAGEFLVMAASLTYVKSRMLIPSHGDDDDEEDPRDEITKPLLEYMKIKSAAESLAERELLGEDLFARKPDIKKYAQSDDDEIIEIGLFELIESFQKILANAAPEDRIEFSSEKISVRDRINEIAEILEEKGSITFEELVMERPVKSMLIVTFLAILEMVKISLIMVAQHKQTGLIRVFYI